jgi:hypothetical protein
MKRSKATRDAVACTAALCLIAFPSWGQVVEFGDLLVEKEWEALGMVTGFHSVVHKKTRLEARLLEADGSASVAHDPVALFLVVTNNGTSDNIERIWRLPRGVAAVRGVSARDCGIDVRVYVDKFDKEERVSGRTPRTLRLCFLSTDGKMEQSLRMTEAPK